MQTFATFPTPFARWSRWVAVFCVQLLLLGVLLHRFSTLPTPVALNLFAAAIAGAAIAVLLGVLAAIVIWRRGRSGSWAAATGILIGVLILAWPAAYVPRAMTLPPINDVTTDPLSPPRLSALAKVRAKSGIASDYAGPAAARLQQEHYPDIKPVVIARPIAETFDIVGDTVRRMKWSIVAQEPPQGRGKPGTIEATSRTLVLGFHDDVVIRLDGDERETRIDVRSVSRYGRHDFGRNATRVRQFFSELQSQLESSVPGTERRRRRRELRDAVPKRPRGGPVASQGQTTGRDPARPGARRVQLPKETPRSKGEAQARDKRSGQ